MCNVSSIQAPGGAQRDPRDVQKGGFLRASTGREGTGVGDGDRRERRDGGLYDVRLPTESGRGGCLRDAPCGCSERRHQGDEDEAARSMTCLLVCHRHNPTFLFASSLTAVADEGN